MFRLTDAEPRRDISWPPKSPDEVLASSPSGRKRLERIRDARSGSPTPIKRRRVNSAAIGNPLADRSNGTRPSGEDDDDEETLQLQLQEIQARLRLKKLQKAKKKNAADDDSDEENIGPAAQEKGGQDRSRHLSHAARPAQTNVQVPHSPKRRELPQQSESPRRVQLGIDKGLKASDVSLKRARSAQDRSQGTVETRNAQRGGSRGCNTAKLQSFIERLANARGVDAKRQQRQERVQKSRSHGFGVGSETRLQEPEEDGSHHSRLPRHQSDPIDEGQRNATISVSNPSRFHSKTGDNAASEQRALREPSGTSENKKDNESFSDFWLSKRRIDHGTLARAFKGKELYPIPRLLKEVTAPEYDPPDVDDYVVLGIIASKSSPYDHVPTHKQHSNADPTDPSTASQTSKFMVLHLTDLKWELDMFLFGTAYEAFWKLTVGTVIAVLNPGVMPPKPHLRDTGKFSLKLGSSEDTVLEVGSAADLGFCKSVKKDGKECMAWIDRQKTEYCDFHVNLQVEKARAGRMEINSMSGLSLFTQRPGGRGAGRGRGGAGRGGRRARVGARERDDGLRPEGRYYDREAHEAAWVVPPELQRGLNARQLLDAEDYGPDGRLSAAERSRKRCAAQEKERSLAEQLGSQGQGLGGEYMRLKKRENRHKASADEEGSNDLFNPAPEEPPDAKALDLIGGRTKVRLSPSKNGKSGTHPGRASDAIGWSGALKRGLCSPSRATSPARKKSRLDADVTAPVVRKARFMLDVKGIRTPGQESVSKGADDDDELDII